LLALAGTVEKDVVPVRGVEVFDSGQGEALSLDGAAQTGQFFDGPEPSLVLGDAPAVSGTL
jgi:hypothetical protein